MRDKLALALVFLVALSALLPLAALSQTPSEALAYVEVARSDARLVAAYRINATQVGQLASGAYTSYEEGNYSGAIELAREAMDLSAGLLSLAHPTTPPANGSTLALLLSELQAASSSPWLGANATLVRRLAEEGLSLLGAGNLTGAYAYAERALGLLVRSGEASSSSGLSLGLSLLAGDEGRAEVALEGNVSLSLGPIGNASLAVLDAQVLASLAQKLLNGTPSGLVAALRTADELAHMAANISPSYNMSYRLSAAERAITLASKAWGYIEEAEGLLDELNQTIAQAKGDLELALGSVNCSSTALLYYYGMNLSGSGLKASCAEDEALGMPNATLSPGLLGNLTGLATAISGLLNSSSLLPAAAGVPAAYSNLSGAVGLIDEASHYVSEGLRALSLGLSPSGNASEAYSLASEALSIAGAVNATPARAYVSATAIAVYRASSAAIALSSLTYASSANMTLLASISRPSNVTGQGLVLNLTACGLSNTSKALTFYSESLDSQAQEYLYASEKCLSRAMSLVTELNSSGQVSYAVADLAYDLAYDAYQLDQEILTGMQVYTSPPSSYVSYVIKGAWAIGNASEALWRLSLAGSELSGGNWTGFRDMIDLSNESLWSTLGLASSLRGLLSISYPVEETAMRALSDLAALVYWGEASGLFTMASLGLSAFSIAGANLTAPEALVNASAEALSSLTRALNVTGQYPAVSASTNATIWLGCRDLLRASLAAGGLLNASALAATEMSTLSSEALQTSEALSYLRGASANLSASLSYSASGSWAAAGASLSGATAYLRLLASLEPEGGPAGYVATLAGPLGSVAGYAGGVEDSLRSFWSELNVTESLLAAAVQAVELSGSARLLDVWAAQDMAAGWPANSSGLLSQALVDVMSSESDVSTYEALGELPPGGPLVNVALLAMRLLLASADNVSQALSALSLGCVNLSGPQVIAYGRGLEVLGVYVQGDLLVGLLIGQPSSACDVVVGEQGPVLILRPS
ncbi:MAG: hypothetical protein ACP5HK_05730 [Acidilobus sp.]